MKVYIASDHAGYVKKNELAEALSPRYTIVDLGPDKLDPTDDYPIYAKKVAKAVAAEPGSFGILLCRSGEGMEIAANKIDGARAALVWKPHLAAETRSDNDSNILVFASGEHSIEEMSEISEVFLTTPFSHAARHERRLGEIEEIEDQK